MSIRNKVFIFLLLSAVLPLTLVAMTVLPFHRSQLMERETTLLEASVRTRADRGAAVLKGESRETLQQIADQLPSLGMTPEILFFSREATGEFTPATQPRFNPTRDLPYDDMRGLLTSAFRDEDTHLATIRDQRGTMTVAAARRVPGTEHAAIVKLDLAEILAPNTTLRDQFLVLAFIAIALAGLLALVLARAVSGPLLRLSRTVSTFDTPKPERIELEGNDEVATLARSFRNMWERIKGYNEELEKAVWKRTAEMQEAKRSMEVANAALTARVEEIEKLYAMAVGSDMTADELKERLNKLRKDAGKP